MTIEPIPPSSGGAEWNVTPCMKTLSVKILAKCWVTQYEAVTSRIGTVITVSDIPNSSELSELTMAAGRKNVANAVLVLVHNRSECGEELFLPFLEMRCQKEMSLLKEKKEHAPSGTEQDFYSSALTAWENIFYAISRDDA